MYGGRVQYAIARAVYGQIRYAQGKPGGVPADIIGLGRHLSEIEGFYRTLILKPSLQRTETIIIELNRAPMRFARTVEPTGSSDTSPRASENTDRGARAHERARIRAP